MRLKNIALKSLSLGIGLAITIILVAKICFELSYDRCYRDYENIYQIRTGYDQQGHLHDFAGISGAVAPGFRLRGTAHSHKKLCSRPEKGYGAVPQPEFRL